MPNNSFFRGAMLSCELIKWLTTKTKESKVTGLIPRSESNNPNQMEEEEGQISTGNQYRNRSGGGGGSDTSINITALDGIVNVNSLFTFAVFVGLAWNPSDPTDVAVPACSAGKHVTESMVSFHVYSFSCFLFSSLVALCLKQIALAARVNRVALRTGIISSAVGSVFGCGFLMLALVNLVQIKLGTIGCAGGATLAAVVPLFTLIPAAMFIYIAVIFYAFTR